MKESGLILNQESPLSLSAYEVSKKVVTLLRHCQTIQREDTEMITVILHQIHCEIHATNK